MATTPQQLAEQSRDRLVAAADPEIAERSKRFFKPWETVHLYGLTTPQRRRIERDLFESVRKQWSFTDGLAFCQIMIRQRHLDEKAVGINILGRFHRTFERDLFERARSWLDEDLCDNWALTDSLCSVIIAPLLRLYPDVIPDLESWATANNLWVRRAAAVALTSIAAKGDSLDVAYRIALLLLPDQHDLIHKATGWLLREAGKTDSARLEAFLLSHGPKIPRTALRYAIEKLPQERRKMLLAETRHG